MGRPKSKHNPIDYTFKLWESNKLEIEKLTLGTRSYEINVALQNHFRIRDRLKQDILFQIEEHKKVIEQHQRSITLLEEELGKQQEKQKEEVRKKENKLREIYDGLCYVITTAYDPY